MAVITSEKLDLSKTKTPTGTAISCKGWIQEAALRMLHNNLDPEVAERPEDLVVYGGTGKAARSWDAFDVIVRELRTLGDDETLLVQSGEALGLTMYGQMTAGSWIYIGSQGILQGTYETFVAARRAYLARVPARGEG